MVKRMFNFVYREVRGLHQAAYVLALFAVGSQILAIVRDRLLAHTFGAGPELDLYYTAFRIPDLLFVLFASVLSVYVLLPYVAREDESKQATSGKEVLSQVFTIFLVVYTVASFLIAITAPLYLHIIFPGFTEHLDTLTLLMQVLLLQPFLLGLSSLCGVVTQMSHRFVLYAISPLLYNIGIIVGIAVLYPMFGLLGLVSGVVLGALGHLLVQVPYMLNSTHRFGLATKFDWKLLGKIIGSAIPRALTLSVNQIVMLIFVGMATVMASGSVSVFQFAYNLQSVPLAIIGMSYSVAAFPTLSLLYAKQDKHGFNLQLLTAFRHIIFWSMPIIALVIVLRAQIVRVLLGSGEFDWADTRLTAAVLAVFVFSLVAQAILLLLTRAFYACGRVMIPLIIALFSGTLAVALAIIFSSSYGNAHMAQSVIESWLRVSGVGGTEILALVVAFAIGQFVQLLFMMIVSVRHFQIKYHLLMRLLWQSSLAAFMGGSAAYITLVFIVGGVNQETFIGIFIQGLTAGIAGLVAVILVYRAVQSPELSELSRSFKAKVLKSDEIVPQQETL
jgi:putative peptidoglycan lipid II flippase